MAYPGFPQPMPPDPSMMGGGGVMPPMPMDPSMMGGPPGGMMPPGPGGMDPSMMGGDPSMGGQGMMPPDPTGGMGVPPGPDQLLPGGPPPDAPPPVTMWVPYGAQVDVNDGTCGEIGGSAYQNAQGEKICLVVQPGEMSPPPPGFTPVSKQQAYPGGY